MPKIFLKYAQDMPYAKICPRYAQNIPKICQNLKNINDSLTDWIFNMDPRDATASELYYSELYFRENRASPNKKN